VHRFSRNRGVYSKNLFNGKLQRDFKNRNPKEILVPDLITRVMTISVDDVFGQVPSHSNGHFSQVSTPLVGDSRS
jgi:hypothetical protein